MTDTNGSLAGYLLRLKNHTHCPLWFTRVPVVTCHVCCFVLSRSSYHGYMIILTRIDDIVCFFLSHWKVRLFNERPAIFRAGKGTETLHQFATWTLCRLLRITLDYINFSFVLNSLVSMSIPLLILQPLYHRSFPGTILLSFPQKFAWKYHLFEVYLLPDFL